MAKLLKKTTVLALGLAIFLVTILSYWIADYYTTEPSERAVIRLGDGVWVSLLGDILLAIGGVGQLMAARHPAYREQKPFKPQPSVIMDKRLIAIGLVGGIIALVGVFAPWMTVSVMGFSAGASGWDSTSDFSSPYVVLAGGILASLGSLGVLAGLKGVGFLLPLGGIMATGGAAWGYSQVTSAVPEAVSSLAGLGIPAGVFGIGVGSGIYVCIVGGVLAIVGSLGLRGK
jgi:hypothetical protein